MEWRVYEFEVRDRRFDNCYDDTRLRIMVARVTNELLVQVSLRFAVYSRILFPRREIGTVRSRWNTVKHLRVDHPDEIKMILNLKNQTLIIDE